MILVMGVNPGYTGQIFLESQLEKIRILRRMIGDRAIDLVVDGGVSIKNARRITMAGATTLVAGQSVFQNHKLCRKHSSLTEGIDRIS